MAFGCQFSDAFSDAFAVCVAVAAPASTKGRHPQLISIATGKPIDLLAITDEELVETHVVLAGSTSGLALTHPALALVERTSGGVMVVSAHTYTAAALVDRVGGGVISASLRTVEASVAIVNDDLEILYLAGVL